ncbi:MAG: hypothetical protein ACKPKO_30520, partial [Candidatus Fonsibacter sp.]
MKGGIASVEDEIRNHNDIARLSGMHAETYPLRDTTGSSIRHAVDHFRLNLLLNTDTDCWGFIWQGGGSWQAKHTTRQSGT